MNFLSGQMDYIFFFYGLAFFVMGLLCLLLSKEQNNRIEWFYLALFGLIHGVNEWLDMIALDVNDSRTFGYFRLVVLMISFIFLYEFARTTARNLDIKLFSRRFYWVLIGAGVAGLFLDQVTANVIIRYTLGLPSALMAAYVLNKDYTRTSKLIKYLAAVFVLEALFAGLIGPKAAFFPAYLINSESFLSTFLVPVQVFRGLIATAGAVIIWIYHEEIKALRLKAKGFILNRPKSPVVLSLLLLVVILVVGWSVTQFTGNRERSLVSQRGKSASRLALEVIRGRLANADSAVDALSGSPSIFPALVSKDPKALDLANSVLDRYIQVFGLSVCYLTDTKGNVIASSNRNTRDSFVGQNIVFRPYYHAPLSGENGGYFAVGTVTSKRGYYASSPVYIKGKVAGIAVTKTDIDNIESSIRPDSIAIVADRDGIVFLSNNKDLIFRALWPVDKKTIEDKIAQKQFDNIWGGNLMQSKIGDDQVLDFLGSSVYVSATPVHKDGWTLYTMYPARSISQARAVIILMVFIFILLYIALVSFLMGREDLIIKATFDKEQLFITLQSIGDAIITTDTLGRIVMMNNVAQDLLGVKPGSFIGKNIEEAMKIVEATTRAPIENPVLEALRTKNAVKLKNQAVLLSADGKERNISDSASPIKSKDGSMFFGMVLVFRDVTERIIAENRIIEALRFTQTLIDNMPNPVFYKNTTGQFLGCNKAFEDYLGVSKKEIIGKTAYDLNPAGLAKKSEDMDNELLSNPGIQKYEAQVFYMDGTEHDVIFNKATFANNAGKTAGIVGVIVDISDIRKAQEALRDSEALLRTVVTNLQGVVFSVDKDGIFTLSDGKALSSLGLTPGQVVGQSVFEVYKEIPEIVSGMKKALSGKLWEGEADIHGVIFDTFVSPVFDDQENVEGATGIGTDITLRKHQEMKILETQNNLQATINAIPDPLFELGLEGLYYEARSPHAELLAVPPVDMIGKNVNDILPKEAADTVISALKEADEKGFSQGKQFELLLEKGSVWFELSVSHKAPLPGQNARFIVLSRDITERKKIEKELKELSDMKSEFVAIVSHELRTPLTIIKEAASLINTQVYGKLSEKQTKIMDMAEGNIRNLEKLINNLLDISKLEAKRQEVNAVEFDACETVAALVEQLKPRAIAKKIEMTNAFDVSSAHKIFADADKFRQIVTNLIANAVNYNKESGKIHISGSDEGEFLRIEVSDTGIGIKEENMPKLFEKFRQFDRVPGSGPKGTGLGLAITKALVELHGGKMWAESKYGEGTKFLFTFPKHYVKPEKPEEGKK